MHKLIDYICDELMEVEQKVAQGGQLSMQELQVVDTLAHTKKNLLKAQEMEQQSYRGTSYRGGSYGYMYDDGRSYRRGARRDSMGRYASDAGYSRNEESDKGHERMMQRLQEIMHDTPDERERRKLDELISEYGGM